LVRELRSTRSCDFLNRGSVSDKRYFVNNI
jgi:hypothetical protein